MSQHWSQPYLRGGNWKPLPFLHDAKFHSNINWKLSPGIKHLGHNRSWVCEKHKVPPSSATTSQTSTSFLNSCLPWHSFPAQAYSRRNWIKLKTFLRHAACGCGWRGLWVCVVVDVVLCTKAKRPTIKNSDKILWAEKIAPGEFCRINIVSVLNCSQTSNEGMHASSCRWRMWQSPKWLGFNSFRIS